LRTLFGHGGDDYFTVGQGTKVIDGGTGSDTVEIDDQAWVPAYTADGITVSLVLQGLAQATGVGNWTLTGIENLSGSFGSDEFTGDGNDNTLAGAGGDDVLIGGGGNDVLQAAPGDDVVIQGFTAGAGLGDTLDLQGRGLTFDWLMAHTTDVDGSAVLDLDGQHITFAGVGASSLSQDDFMLG